MAMGSLLGRFGVGAVVDKLPARSCLAVVPLFTAACLMGATLCSGSAAVGAAALFGMGLTYGMNAVATPVLVNRMVGSNNFSPAFGFVFSAWGVSGVLAPCIAGKLFDLMGGYTLSMAVALGAALASTASAVLLPLDAPPNSKPKRH